MAIQKGLPPPSSKTHELGGELLTTVLWKSSEAHREFSTGGWKWNAAEQGKKG